MRDLTLKEQLCRAVTERLQTKAAQLPVADVGAADQLGAQSLDEICPARGVERREGVHDRALLGRREPKGGAPTPPATSKHCTSWREGGGYFRECYQDCN
jgi:hypothetical protein